MYVMTLLVFYLQVLKLYCAYCATLRLSHVTFHTHTVLVRSTDFSTVAISWVHVMNNALEE